MEKTSNSSVSKTPYKESIIFKIFTVVGVLFSFLVALKLMSIGFESFGEHAAKNLIRNYTTNPLTGLFIGLFATAITQSSSLTTSIVVGLVGTGQFPNIETAIPIIIGANIGTSVTSTLVSMGHISNKREFRKAISAATLHDFFNLLVTLVIFPIQVYTNFLGESAALIYDIFSSDSPTDLSGQTSGFSPISGSVKYVAKLIHALCMEKGMISLLVSFTLLFLSLKFLSKILKSIFIGGNQKKFEARVFGNPFKSMLWGLGLTAAVQSSSVTTSLTVPLVANGVIRLKKIFPFILGANIGTTFTALIASLSTPTEAAVTIALCHLLYNVLGVILFMLIPYLQKLPIYLATGLGLMTLKRRWYGFAYIIGVFFILPVVLIALSQ